MKRVLLIIVALFFSVMVVEAQDYSRYNYFHDEAVRLIGQGKLVEAKVKLEAIKRTCKGAIPPDNDLDALIYSCIVISPATHHLQFDPEGGEEQCVSVTSNMGQFKAGSNASWCRISKKTKDKICVVCDDNLLPIDRTATITLNVEGKTSSISVSQIGGEVSLMVQPDTLYFSKENWLGKVIVNTNAASWDVDYVPSWMETEIISDTLSLRCLVNDRAMAREATFYVTASDQMVPVYVVQAGADTLISVNCDEMVFPSEENIKSFFVSSNFDGWQATSPNEWIETWVEQDSVRVKTLRNYSVFSRHGMVKVDAGRWSFDVAVHQQPYVSERPMMRSELQEIGVESSDEIHVNSFPNDIKVIVYNDDHTVSSVRYTPFTMSVDYLHYTLQVGFEKKEAFLNDKQEDMLFEPGLRFAAFTWSPKTAVGMMSGFVGSHSWGAYAHFQANTPFVSDFDGEEQLSGYNMTFGPVFQPRRFPYVGAYLGLGMGAYVAEPHFGLDYEAGLMGFYKNMTLALGFHTSRVNSSVSKTSFMIGVGGYLKRYYDSELGYCASDSRRWTSLNYVFRPSGNGKGLMIGDIGKGKTRVYFKAMYLQPETADSLSIKNLEAGLGLLFTPVNGIIDMCIGASVEANLFGMDARYQGVGVEVGTIVNVWRFPLTVFLHETDLLGERHLVVDFGIGFHLGKFGIAKSTYQ